MELTISLAILAAAILALAFLRWHETRPVELGTVRLIPHMPLMVLCAVIILVAGGHLMVVLLK
jgi:uncharacterized membrane protein YidH (DUF202 family)